MSSYGKVALAVPMLPPGISKEQVYVNIGFNGSVGLSEPSDGDLTSDVGSPENGIFASLPAEVLH